MVFCELLIMDEDFKLPASVNGKEILFPCKLIQLGYIYRVEVDVNSTIISFERDEERNWRALINNETTSGTIELSVVNAIIETLESL